MLPAVDFCFNYCTQSVTNARKTGVCCGGCKIENSVSAKNNSSFPTFSLFQIRSSEMELCFKIAAVLLLLVQAFQSASLQHSTDSPGRTIDKSWLRDLARNRTGGQAALIPTDGAEPDQGFDTTLDPSHESSGGITSGFMSTLGEEEENKDADEDPDDLNVVTTSELPVDLNVNISATTPDSTNMTDVEKELNDSSVTSPNFTTFTTAENSTHWSDYNQSDSLTTLAPGVNATQKTATTSTEDVPSINTTEPTDTRTTKVSETSTRLVFATNFLTSTSSETSHRTTSLQVQDTPGVANKTGTAAGTGSSSERGRLPFPWQQFLDDFSFNLWFEERKSWGKPALKCR